MKRLILLWLLLPSLSYAVCNGGSTNEASPDTGTTASQTVDGVTFTWTFNCSGGAAQCGFLRDGTPWARCSSGGNLTIASVTPDDANSGLQKNPGIGGSSTRSNKYQGLYALATEAPFQASLDISDELPYLAVPDNGVYVKAKAYTGGECGYTAAVGSNCIDTYAALVVLQNLPPDGILGGETFRPGASGATKILFTEDDFDLPIWPSIAAINAASNYTTIVNRWNSPYPDFFPGNNGDQGRRWTPHARGLNDYGNYRAETYLTDTFGTMDSDSSAGKDDARYALIQFAIEMYSAYAQGTEWVGGAGQSMGRWHPIVLFSTVLKDSHASAATIKPLVRAATDGMGTNINGSQVQFTDLYQIRDNLDGWPIWGSYPGEDGCIVGSYWRDYGAEATNYPGGESKRTCGDPYGYTDGPGRPGMHYASCCSTGLYIGYALLQKIWPEYAYQANNPTMRDYAERVMNGAGWWTAGDQCAVADPRENIGCLPYTTATAQSTCAVDGGGNLLYYGKTWGLDLQSGDNSCVTKTEATSRGHPAVTGRWPSDHLNGRPTNIQHCTPGCTYWDTLVTRTGNTTSATASITNDD
jgi:hypothetical protein